MKLPLQAVAAEEETEDETDDEAEEAATELAEEERALLPVLEALDWLAPAALLDAAAELDTEEADAAPPDAADDAAAPEEEVAEESPPPPPPQPASVQTPASR